MAIKPRLKALLPLTVLSLAMIGAGAHAQSSMQSSTQSTAQGSSIPIVTGEHWVKSSVGERKAYLVGIANLLEVERAYAGKNARSDDIAQRFGKGMQGHTLDSVRQSLDSYYAANPQMIQHPVIETLWFQVVKPGLDKAQ